MSAIVTLRGRGGSPTDLGVEDGFACPGGAAPGDVFSVHQHLDRAGGTCQLDTDRVALLIPAEAAVRSHASRASNAVARSEPSRSVRTWASAPSTTTSCPAGPRPLLVTSSATEYRGGVPRLKAPAAAQLLNPGDCPGRRRSRDARALRRLRRLRRNPAEQLQLQLHRRALAGKAGRRRSGRPRCRYDRCWGRGEVADGRVCSAQTVLPSRE